MKAVLKKSDDMYQFSIDPAAALEILEGLTDIQAGKVFRAVLMHAVGDSTPPGGALEGLAAKVLCMEIDRRKALYERKAAANRENGAKGGRPPKSTPKASEKAPPKEKAKTFQVPDVKEVSAYCEERKNSVDPARFWDYYEARGWMVGKSKMKDWRACVRTCERNTSEGGAASGAGDGIGFRESNATEF